MNMDNMTRSDLLLATHHAYDFLDKLREKNTMDVDETMQLISHMNQKIENVYEIVFVLEKHENAHWKELGELLRKCLES